MENLLELINNNNFDEIIKIKDFTTKKINENYIIHLLAIRGNEKGLDFFIKHKSFDINLSNEFGLNIIHLLFKYGWDSLAEKYYKMFPELLSNVDDDIYIPLTYCLDRFETFVECFKFMKKNKDILIKDILNNVSVYNDNIILLLIKKSKNKEDDIYLKFLIENIDIIEFNKPRVSPVLIFCILNDKTILAKYFIENNKGLKDKNYYHLLPINIACGKNNIEIVKILLDKNSDIEYGGLDNDYLPLNIVIKI
jgi:ankyrin repeat protein